MNKICFREEAKDWNEALPIGNGFLGAMVFGKSERNDFKLTKILFGPEVLWNV